MQQLSILGKIIHFVLSCGKDKVYEMLIKPDEKIDSTACACAQLIFQGLDKIGQERTTSRR